MREHTHDLTAMLTVIGLLVFSSIRVAGQPDPATEPKDPTRVGDRAVRYCC